LHPKHGTERMSETPETLLTLLKSDIELPLGRNTVFGDQSALAQLLTEAFTVGTAMEAVRTVMATPKSLFLDDEVQQSQAQALLEGLENLLTAVPLCANRAPEAVPWIRKGIEQLDKAFGLGNQRARLEPSSGDLTKLHPVDQAFAQMGAIPCTDRAWFMAYDLLCDWVPFAPNFKPDGSQPASRPSPQTATISVLGAVASGLFRLQVDLFRSVDGTFDPDPRWFGLTAIRWDSDSEHCLLRSMDRIWKLSQLSTNWRGRWRIVHAPDRERLQDLPVTYPNGFRDRSAEAATLCALLAATGDPYGVGQKQLGHAPAIDIEMAISAVVEPAPGDSQNPVLEAQLGPVEGSEDKLAVAASQINTVVFSPKLIVTTPGQPEPPQLAEIKQLRAAEQQKKWEYDGMRIAEAATIIDALDLVLLTNRHLQAYHQEQRQWWLKHWIDGTGISQEFDPDQSVPPKEGDAPLPSGSAR
jgi:hypothetical protein